MPYNSGTIRRSGNGLPYRLLERHLLRNTTVVVPLLSQQQTISRIFHLNAQKVHLPFIEPFGMVAASPSPLEIDCIPPDEPTRVLLLGNWGPQKDLAGALEGLRAAHERGARFSVSITGAINPQFPDYRERVKQAVASIGADWLTSLGYVPESKLLRVVASHDLLILPYNATGGYSGALSLGVYCGTGVIAYDLPQLREAAMELGVTPTFVRKGDRNEIVEEIFNFCTNIRRFRELRQLPPRPEYDAIALAAVERLIDIIKT